MQSLLCLFFSTQNGCQGASWCPHRICLTIQTRHQTKAVNSGSMKGDDDTRFDQMATSGSNACLHAGSLVTLRPCRTASSDKISKCLNSTPACCSASTTLALNPQRGSAGLPFMNSMTGAECTSLFKLVSSALCLVSLPEVPFVAADVDAVPLLANLLLDGGAIDPLTDAPDPKCLLTLCVSDAASAPSTWSTTLSSCTPPDRFLTLCHYRDLHCPADTLPAASFLCTCWITCSSKGMHAHICVMIMRHEITFTIAKNGTAVTPYSSEMSDSSSAST